MKSVRSVIKFFFFVTIFAFAVFYSSNFNEIKSQTCSGTGTSTYTSWQCVYDDTVGNTCATNGIDTNTSSCVARNGRCEFQEDREEHCVSDGVTCFVSNQCGGLNAGTCWNVCSSTPTPTSGGGGGGGGGGNPIGFHDSTTCSQIVGWTCDDSNYSQPLDVHFYVNGASGAANFLGITTANITREPAVGTQCGGFTNHGFVYNLPAAYINGSNTFYAYAINIGGGTGNPLLLGSPKAQIGCVTQTPSPPNTITNTPTSTPPPSCSVSSASFASTSINMTVGNSQSIAFNVTDSPSGCTTDASFSSSNSSVGITSTNPDTTEPFGVTVSCNSSGTATVTGRARYNGNVIRTDTVSVTCTPPGTPTQPPATPTPVPSNTPTTGPGTSTPTPRPATPTPTVGPGTPTPTPSASCTVNSASFAFSTVSLNVGVSQTYTLNVSDSPLGCTTDASFSSSNSGLGITSTNPDAFEPFNVTVVCNSAGSTVVTGRARVSGTTLQSDTLGVTCLSPGTPTLPPATPTPTSAFATPTFTPTPLPTFTPTPSPVPVCAIPIPRDPPERTCGNPGTVTWEWNDVAGANQYNLIVETLTGGVVTNVQDYGWLAGSTNFGAGCNGDGVGVCTRTETRPSGTYRSRIRAGNSNLLFCMPSGFGSSSAVNLVECPGISIQDVTISGTGNTTTILVSVTNGTISQVDFSVDLPSVATLSPLTDTSAAFTTTATSVGIGETFYHATGTDAYGNSDTKTAKITVVNPPPWWRTSGGDAMSTATLSSSVPVGELFAVDGTGGYPGIPIYLDTNLTSSNTSSRGWRVDSPLNLSANDDYSYSYFRNRLPTNVTPTSGPIDLLTSGTLNSGYYIIHYIGGNLTLPAVNLGPRKVILYVDSGDLTLNGPITLNDGTGFFMVIVNGNILVSPTLGGSATADLEGIYYAQNQFKTGSNVGDDNDITLRVRGTVVGIGNLIQNGIVLERELPDNTNTPAENFIFAPDQLTRFPQFLGKRGIRWTEVAP